MSSKDPRVYLRDMLESSNRINLYLEGYDFEMYQDDSKTKSAVERQLQIRTEAAFRLGEDIERICPGPNWRDIRGLGNMLRHAYELLDDAIIWKSVLVDLPPLRKDVLSALSRLPPIPSE